MSGQGSALSLDPGLPGLAQALDAEAMEHLLRPLCSRLHGGAESEWRVVAIDLLKHKPAHRCALGYTMEGACLRVRLFAKAFAGDRGAQIFVTMGAISRALNGSSLIVPRPLGYFPGPRLLVTEFLEGAPLAAALYDGREDGPALRAAEAIAALHDSGASFTRRWSPLREVANTAEWLRGLEDRAPRLAARARSLLETLSRPGARLPEPPDVPVHRDYYADQVWDCGGRTALLDLDDARGGDPALDVGNFLAHLTLRSLQFPVVESGCLRARGLFTAGYLKRRGERAGEAFARRAAFYEATSLLRLCGVYAQRDRWAGRLPGLLMERCEESLKQEGVQP